MGVRNGGKPKIAAGLFSRTMQDKKVFYGIGFVFVWHTAIRINVLQWHSPPLFPSLFSFVSPERQYCSKARECLGVQAEKKRIRVCACGSGL